MANKYLNNTGLSYFWNKIKTITDGLSSRVTTVEGRFTYKNGVSTHSLTKSGLYYCNSTCTDIPFPGTWVISVISNPGGTNVKQVARLLSAEGAEFEQHLMDGQWTGWIEVGRIKPFASANLHGTGWFRKAGNANYGSFLILGTIGGIGGVAIAGIINNGSLGTVRNLMTNADWSNSKLTLSYSITDGIGYIGLTTTSTSASTGMILCG